MFKKNSYSHTKTYNTRIDLHRIGRIFYDKHFVDVIVVILFVLKRMVMSFSAY